MKKLLSILLLSFACLTFTIPALAQATDPVEQNIVETYLMSLGGVATLILVLTAVVFKAAADANKIIKQIISIVIGAGIGLVGYYWNVGMFTGLNMTWCILYGLGAALMANGLYSYDLITMILEFLKIKIPTTRK